ncbi:hypothetical protein GOP47_0009841 [Adiantum capillus-veneris]|uniref:RING-type E3 ubiquitin transferase n=1 Tax=Adiantum capillus-veneris TaxID=13818 RepID=A0A9D4UX13_ADICA|nr:hypothetical protein GOP47_0009841 [Adiantum capillus-veneris]
MERRANRIVKAVVLLAGILVGVFLLLWLLLCLATCFSNYLRRLVLAMNDEAASADATDDDEQQQPTPHDDQLDKAFIDKLPLVEYHAEQITGKHEGSAIGIRTLAIECGVCLAEFQEREALRLLPTCQHCFHPTCIATWLSSHSTCPLCRRSLAASPAAAPPPHIAAGPRLFSVVNLNDIGGSPLARA